MTTYLPPPSARRGCSAGGGVRGAVDDDWEDGVSEWQPIESAPVNELVWTKIHDADGERNVAKLYRDRGLWFLSDKSMYVYYTPTHWRRADQTARMTPSDLPRTIARGVGQQELLNAK